MKNRKALGFITAGLVAGLALGSLGVASAASAVKTASASATTSAKASALPAPKSGRGGAGGPAGGPGGGVIGKPGFGGEGDVPEALAQLTGLTFDEIQTKRAAGASFAAIAKSKSVAEDELIAATIKIEKKECANAVAASKITNAEQAEAMADIEARLKTFIEDTSAMPAGRGTPPAAPGTGTSTGPSTATQ